MTAEPNVQRFTPSDDDRGKRIDAYLAERITDCSRSRIQDLIDRGHVSTEQGQVRKSNFRLWHTAWVELAFPDLESLAAPPEDLKVPIVFEDEWIAVVNKPVGMSTHPTPARTTGTLVNALLFQLNNLSGIGGVLRPGIVHRLDKVTSGLLVIAKTQRAHERLAEQFRRRTIQKIYRALCLGVEPDASGVIEKAIERDPIRRARMRAGFSGRASVTHYTRIAARHPLYGFKIRPVTGRTHQIRVHLESIRCPIVGDKTYGYETKRWPWSALNPDLKEYPGILLHAERLAFSHPESGEPLRFCVPPPIIYRKVWESVFKEKLDSFDAAE